MDISAIDAGMTKEDVITEIGETDVYYTSSLKVVGYKLCDGSVFVIEYTEQSGELVVDTVRIEGGNVDVLE